MSKSVRPVPHRLRYPCGGGFPLQRLPTTPLCRACAQHVDQDVRRGVPPFIHSFPLLQFKNRVQPSYLCGMALRG